LRLPPPDPGRQAHPRVIRSERWLDRVTASMEGAITPDDVRRTGLSVDELRASIADECTFVRIEHFLVGADPLVRSPH
jgi:hypothetical protein